MKIDLNNVGSVEDVFKQLFKNPGKLMKIVKKVGFVGTGIMGAPMARNIAQSGFPVSVYNRTAEKATPFSHIAHPWIDLDRKHRDLQFLRVLFRNIDLPRGAPFHP